MRQSTTLSIFLLFAAVLVNCFAEEICRNRDGFTIEERFEYLEEHQFTVPYLKDRFEKYLTKRSAGELMVAVTSDRELLNDLESQSWKPFNVHAGFDDAGATMATSKPLAIFFRIGDNAFFEYRDRFGQNGLEVLRGENVLFRSFKDGVEVWYVGELFSTNGDERSCVDQRRSMVFVVPKLDQLDPTDLKGILNYYDSLLKYPGNLDITLYRTFREAAIRKQFVLPSLKALAEGYASHAAKPQRYVTYFRDKVGTDKHTRHLRVYEGERLIYSGDEASRGKTN